MGVGFCFVPELKLFGLCIRKDETTTTIVSENRLTKTKDTYEVLSSIVQPIRKIFSISGTTIYDGDIFISSDSSYIFVEYIGKGNVSISRCERLGFYSDCRGNATFVTSLNVKSDAKSIAQIFSKTILFCNSYEINEDNLDVFEKFSKEVYTDVFLLDNKHSKYLDDYKE